MEQRQGRLSKLQRWVLGEAYSRCWIGRKEMRGYYGKHWKRDTLTPAERVTIHRSLRSLLGKGLLEPDSYKTFILTQAGVEALLKANELPDGGKNVNFNEYTGRLQTKQAEFEKFISATKAMLRR